MPCKQGASEPNSPHSVQWLRSKTYENFEFKKNVAEQDFFFSDIFRDLFGPGPNWKSEGSTAKLAMLKQVQTKGLKKTKQIEDVKRMVNNKTK